MRIADILRTKGAAVATVTETTTVTGLLTELVDAQHRRDGRGRRPTA